MIVEIVILAMIAAFLGLRLYSVLGRRAEHEEEPVPTRIDAGPAKTASPLAPQPAARTTAAAPRVEGELLVPAIERGVREIAAVDRRFDITAFVEGARGAYAMILEAFWQGDRETLRQLCDDDVYAEFAAAIDAARKGQLALKGTWTEPPTQQGPDQAGAAPKPLPAGQTSTPTIPPLGQGNPAGKTPAATAKMPTRFGECTGRSRLLGSRSAKETATPWASRRAAS